MEYQHLIDSILSEQPYPLLFASISGAHLFGFPSPDSDIDIRGVHILPLEQVISLKKPRETVNMNRVVDDIELDLATHDIKKCFELLLGKSGNMIEEVFSPLVMQTTPEHEELRSLIPQTLTVHHAHHYFGFSKRKWHDFLSKKTAKTLLHVYRVLLTGIHLMQTHQIESNLLTLNALYSLPYVDDLIARKQSDMKNMPLTDVDIEFHEKEYEQLVTRLEDVRDQSTLPQHPAGKEQLSDLLVRIRLQHTENLFHHT